MSTTEISCLSRVKKMFILSVCVFAWILHCVVFTFSVLVCTISKNQSVLHCCVCVWYVCVVFIAPGIMPCGHVRGVAEPERARGGNRWLQNPLPLVFPLPVCLSPSLLRSFYGRSVHLAGRKACCFDASSRDQSGDPARGLYRLQPRAPPSVPLLSWRPHGSGITAVSLCMRLVLVKSTREFPELIHTHTHPRSNRAEKLLDLQMLGWPVRKS